ncbi:MAG: hypothetical protein ACLF0P_08720 [Thermoanaerobaculia bacterium]
MRQRSATRRIPFAVLLLTALSSVSPAEAQELSLAFEPDRPVAGETFLVLVTGEGDGCYTGTHSTTIEGDEVTLTFSDHCPFPGSTRKFTFRMELTLPSAGEWTVNVFNTFTDTLATSTVSVATEPTVESSREAGATLLFPYFEVDPDDPAGRTSLVAIGNTSGTGTLAHVILWTDRGIPTLAFDLFLNARSVQTINLRNVFSGVLPETPHSTLTEPDPYPFCQTPLHLPEISPEVLRAQHSGEPVPGDGMCYSTGRSDLAVGYLTVDVVRRCSRRFPSDPSYFGDFDQIIGTRNVLWGDQFFVDGQEDFAQGFQAVAISADVLNAEPGKTFYRKFAPDGEDARAMLPAAHLARATTGGTFDGGTDFLVWIEDPRLSEPFSCDSPPMADCPHKLRASFTEERGSDTPELFTISSPPVTGRWAVGGPELPVATPFTVAELSGEDPTNLCLRDPPPKAVPLQMSVSGVVKAFGRFSVGIRGAALPE